MKEKIVQSMGTERVRNRFDKLIRKSIDEIRDGMNETESLTGFHGTGLSFGG